MTVQYSKQVTDASTAILAADNKAVSNISSRATTTSGWLVVVQTDDCTVNTKCKTAVGQYYYPFNPKEKFME